MILCIALLLPILGEGTSHAAALMTAKSVSPTTVNKLASYSISIFAEATINAGAYVSFTFPPEAPVTATMTCSVDSPYLNAIDATCTNIGQTISFKNAISSDITFGFPVSLTISGIQNPPSTSATAAISVTLFASDGAILDTSSNDSGMKITATAGSLTAAVTSSSDVVGAEATWTFQLTPTDPTLQNSAIEIIFPIWNANMGTSTSIPYIPRSALCSGISGIASNIACTFSSTTNKLAITGGFPSGTVSGAIVFTVQPVLNPPVGRPIVGFTVSTIDSVGGTIDQSTTVASPSPSVPNTINPSSASVSVSVKTVQQSSIFNIMFYLSNPLVIGYNLEIDVPVEMTINAGVSATSTTCLSKVSTITVSSQTITFTNQVTGYCGRGDRVYITLNSLKNPLSTKPSSPFAIRIKAGDGAWSESGSFGKITATPGTISKNGLVDFLQVTDLSVSAITTYQIEFLLQSVVPAGGAVLVVFPADVYIADRAEAACTSVGLNLGSGSKCIVISQVLTIKGGFTANTTGAVRFSINQVTNPKSTATSGTFSLSTCSDDTCIYLIDTVTTITMTAIPAVLKSASVSALSYITGDNTTYTFTISTTNTIPVNGSVEVRLPSKIIINDVTAATIGCVPGTEFQSGSTCTVTSTSVKVKGFKASPLAPGTTTIVVSNVSNPPSTKVYQSFSVFTYDSSGNGIDALSVGISFQCTAPNNFQQVAATPTSLVNAATTTYTFVVKVRNETPVGSYVVVKAPAQVKIGSGVSCGGDASGCMLTSGSLRVNLNLSAVKITGDSFSFTASGFTNPGITSPTDSFQLATFTSDNYDIDKTTSGIIVTTTTPASILSIGVVASNPKVGNASSYTVSYTPISTHPAGSSVSITIPVEFAVGTVTCTSGTLSVSLTCGIVLKTVTITNGFAVDISPPSVIDVTISGLTNPGNIGPSSVWTIQSYHDAFTIDKSAIVTSSFVCTSPCATCLDLDVTCLSCLASSSVPYFYDGACHAGCKDGYMATSATQCSQCVAPCVKCAGSVSTCTSCAAPTQYLYSSTCNANCLAGYWGDGSNCTPCTNPCKECSSATACTSCTKLLSGPDNGKDTYLLGQTCVVSCGAGFLQNTAAKTCDTCDTKCSTCSGTTSYCTLCSGALKSLDGGCVTACPPDGTYIDTGTSCLHCDVTCATCSGTVTNCVTCATTAFYYNSTCYAQCPVGITVPSAGVCKDCSTVCKTCTVSTTACTSCPAPKLLYKNQCGDTCPADTTILVNDACIDCDSNCLKCKDTITYCTSCSTGKFLYQAKCWDACPTGTTIPMVGACLDCDPQCKTCSGTTTTCKSCYNGFFLYNNTCIPACPASITITSGSNCLPCDSNCAKCSGATTTCTDCQSTWFLYGTTCVDGCPPGITLVSGSMCNPCSSTCLTCVDSTTKCSTCHTNNYLYLSQCFPACPEGYAPNIGVCQQIVIKECATGCTLTMMNNSICEPECNVFPCNYDNGNCKATSATCINGQYVDGTGCSSCQYPCNLCQGLKSCISCQTSSTTSKQLLLDGNQCVDACPTGKVVNGIVCESCVSTCATCQGTKNICLTCQPDLYLYNNNCINDCPQDITIKQGTQCTDCVNCLTCSGTTTTCTSCPTTQVLFNSSCRSMCPDGWTITPTTGNVCQQCLTKCLKCSGSVSSCTQCPGSSFLYLKDCVTTCPPQVTIISDANCLPCSTACATCSVTINSCDSCPSGTVLFAHTCPATCPNGYVAKSGVCVIPDVPAECAPGCTVDLLSNTSCDTACKNPACNNDNSVCLPAGPCPNGQYQSGTYSCLECVYPCNFCVSSATCTSCQVVASGTNKGAQLLLYSGSCYETCPSKTFQSGIFCNDCDTSCKECSGAKDTCVACASSFFLYQGKCSNACPVGITVASGSICLSCSVNCQTCITNFDTCTSCPTGKVLSGTTCVNNCPAGSTTTSTYPTTCQSCSSPCQNCSGDVTSCTSCISGKVLWNTSCLDSCPPKVSITQGTQCTPCQSPCIECDTSPTKCTACTSTTALYEGTCLALCPNGYEPRLGVCTALCSDGCTSILLQNKDCNTVCNTAPCNFDNSICNQPTNDPCLIGQYRDVTVCKSCVYPCNTCQTSAFCNSCLAINDGTNVQQLLYNGSCSLTCPTHTFNSGIICQDCDSSCKECSGSASSQCTSCPTNFKIYKGTCYNACPTGITVEVGSNCVPCSSTCLTCSGDIAKCTSCAAGAVLSNGTCYPECPSGYTTTPTSNGTCVKCSSNCGTCLGDTNLCTSCVVGVLYNSQCLANCPAGYTTLVNDSSVCYKCVTNCSECSTAIDHCTACPAGQFITAAFQCQVKVTCPDGKTITSSSAGICISCVAPCKNCESTTTNCLSCVDGFVLDGNSCKPCETNCKTCLGTTSTCTACNAGLYLSGTQCLVCDSSCITCEGGPKSCTSCDDSHILSGTRCYSCDPTCLTCSGKITTCTSCTSPLFLVDSKCVPCSPTCKVCTVSPTSCGSCNEGSYLTGDTCLPCDTSCKSCSAAPKNCLSCEANKLLLSSNTCASCDPSCKACFGSPLNCISCELPRYLMNDNTCQVCNASCLQCAGAPEKCTSCDPPKILIDQKCYSCDPSCKTCSVVISNCVSCYSSAVLFNSQCLTACPEAYFNNGSTCSKCSSECKGCTSSPTYCTSCPDGFKLTGSACIKTCPVGQYLEIANCVACSQNCVSCVDRFDKCTACPGTKVLNSQSQCEVPCENGYTRTATSNGICLACDSACTSCSGSTSYCTVCKSSNYYLYQGQCVGSCPAGVTITQGNTCVDCGGNCVTCSVTPTQCDTCNSRTYLFAGQCLTVCPKGYQPVGSACQKCATDDCSPVTPPSNTTDPSVGKSEMKLLALPRNSTFNEGRVPFPFIDLTGGCIAVVGVAKCVASGVQFFPSAIALWGVTAVSSWIATGAMIGTYDEPGTKYMNVTVSVANTTRRALSGIEVSGNALIPSLILLLLIIGAGCHVILNVAFFIIYLLQIARRDETFKYWRMLHKPAAIVIPGISLVLSFHFCRLFYCRLFGLETFNAHFEKKAILMKPLTVMSYVSIVCTSAPIIAATVILLIHYDLSDDVWMFGLDCLIVTSLLTLMLLLDTRKMESEMLHDSPESHAIVTTAKDGSKYPADESIKELVNLFPTEDVHGALTAHRNNAKRQKLKRLGRSQSGTGLMQTVATLPIKRRFSYPLMSNEYVEIRPESLEQRMATPRILLEEPANEESLFQKGLLNTSAVAANESTFIQPDEVLPCNPEVSMESEGEELLSADRMGKADIVTSGEIVSRTVMYKTPKIPMWKPLKSGIKPLPASTPLTVVTTMPDEKYVEPEVAKIPSKKDVFDASPPPKPIKTDHSPETASKPTIAIEEKPKPPPTIAKVADEKPKPAETKPKPTEVKPKPTEFKPKPFEESKQTDDNPPKVVSERTKIAPEKVKVSPELVKPIPEKSKVSPELVLKPTEPKSKSPEPKAKTPEPRAKPTPAPEDKPRPSPQVLPSIPITPLPFDSQPDLSEPDHSDTPLNRTQEISLPSESHLFTMVPQQEEPHIETLNSEPAQDPEIEIDTLLDDLRDGLEGEVGEGPVEEAKEEPIDTAQFDIDRAVSDATNPDMVIIPHKYKGYRLKVKNEFNKARIVDLENRVVQSLPPIDEKKYDMSKTIIDETDPQFATLVSKTGEKVRVKRDFGQARIVNLEKRVYHPHAFLIGQTIEREEDFQFTNAYADPSDPEVVVVMHNETGEDVRVRKTYHGAVVVDEEGRAVGPAVDRNDYDIPRTVVDKEDVHVASLKHKIKRTRVRVRRDFRGAKIIDLERRKDPKTPELGGIREPEESPFDQDLSLISQPDSELRTRGWISPRNKKSPRRPILEISEMYPTEDHPENERLEHLAQIIDRYDNEESEQWQSASPINRSRVETVSSGDLTPKSREASKKFFRKPVYHNTGLDKVYGPDARAKSGFAQVDDDSFINEFISSGKKKLKKKVSPAPNEKLRNMEKVYLKRMEVAKRPDTTISRVLGEMDDGSAQEDLIESLNSRFQTDRAHLSSVGEEIVHGGRRVLPFLQTPRQDEL